MVATTTIITTMPPPATTTTLSDDMPLRAILETFAATVRRKMDVEERTYEEYRRSIDVEVRRLVLGVPPKLAFSRDLTVVANATVEHVDEFLRRMDLLMSRCRTKAMRAVKSCECLSEDEEEEEREENSSSSSSSSSGEDNPPSPPPPPPPPVVNEKKRTAEDQPEEGDDRSNGGRVGGGKSCRRRQKRARTVTRADDSAIILEKAVGGGGGVPRDEAKATIIALSARPASVTGGADDEDGRETTSDDESGGEDGSDDAIGSRSSGGASPDGSSSSSSSDSSGGESDVDDDDTTRRLFSTRGGGGGGSVVGRGGGEPSQSALVTPNDHVAATDLEIAPPPIDGGGLFVAVAVTPPIINGGGLFPEVAVASTTVDATALSSRRRHFIAAARRRGSDGVGGEGGAGEPTVSPTHYGRAANDGGPPHVPFTTAENDGAHDDHGGYDVFDSEVANGGGEREEEQIAANGGNDGGGETRVAVATIIAARGCAASVVDDETAATAAATTFWKTPDVAPEENGRMDGHYDHHHDDAGAQQHERVLLLDSKISETTAAIATNEPEFAMNAAPPPPPAAAPPVITSLDSLDAMLRDPTAATTFLAAGHCNGGGGGSYETAELDRLVETRVRELHCDDGVVDATPPPELPPAIARGGEGNSASSSPPRSKRARSFRPGRGGVTTPRYDILWRVKSSFTDDWSYRPGDMYAPVRKEGVFTTMTYDAETKNLFLAANGRRLPFSKTVSSRLSALNLNSFEIQVFAKMGKVVGRHLTLLTHNDMSDVTFKSIADVLKQNQAHVVNVLQPYDEHKPRSAVAREIEDHGGVIFYRRRDLRCRAAVSQNGEARSAEEEFPVDAAGGYFVGFSKSFSRTFAITGLTESSGKTILRLGWMDRDERLVECGTASVGIVGTEFASLRASASAAPADNVLRALAAVHVKFADIRDARIRDACVVKNSKLLFVENTRIFRQTDLCGAL